MLARYIIGESFSGGAQSTIHYAQDRLTGASYLIKAGPSVKQEALLLRELNHPMLSRPIDAGSDPILGEYVVFPKVTGNPISSIASNQNAFLKALREIAEFLSFLHHRGWLYNDFKPDHFRVDERGVHVLDLGLCTPLGPDGSSQSYTYSGTFPFISPERLTGRSCDERSDIFALGMMLLAILKPDEVMPEEPSLESLQEVHAAGLKIRGFWKGLIGEMTAWEPAQRIPTTEELWRRLSPEPDNDESILTYPVPGSYTFSTSLWERNHVVLFHSRSELELDHVRNQVFVQGWRSGNSVIDFDLSEGNVERFFRDLCRIMIGEDRDFYSAISALKTLEWKYQVWIVVANPVSPDVREESMLSYALSVLSSSISFRFLLTSARPLQTFVREAWKIVEIPSLNSEQRDQMLSLVMPRSRNESAATAFRPGNFSYPEQLLTLLQARLRRVPFDLRPVSARQSTKTAPFEQLKAIEKRIVASLAVAGGTLEKEKFPWIDRKEGVGSGLLEQLIAKGYLQAGSDRVTLSVPPPLILERFRKEQIKTIATALLKVITPNSSSYSYYRAARYAKKHRLAAWICVRLARGAVLKGHDIAAMTWYRRGFLAGAVLPESVLYRMVRFSLFRPDMKTVRRLLSHLKTRSGPSFRLADLYMEYFHRTNQLDKARSFSMRASKKAGAQKLRRTELYFLILYAGFCIRGRDLEEGDRILADIQAEAVATSSALEGLVVHFQGLSALHRGNLDIAREFLERAVKLPHKFQETSLMSLGVMYGALGESERAGELMAKAIEKFSKQQDADRLSYAYNNLGIVFKTKGLINEARDYYLRCIHLSRAAGNLSILTAGLNNLATTYALEGRTDLAIESEKKAIALARKGKMRERIAGSLTNLGSHYALRGYFAKAIPSLQTAIRIRTKLGLKRDLGDSYETMGIVYLMRKQYGRAGNFFMMASRLYTETSSEIDRARVSLFLALSQIRKGVESNFVLPNPRILQGNAFEEGLCHHVAACIQLQKHKSPEHSCLSLLHDAEIALRKVPSLYWLAKNHEAKADYYCRTEHFEKAVSSLRAAFNIYSRLGSRPELRELARREASMKIPGNLMDRMAERLPYKLLLMIKNVLKEQDASAMIDRILSLSLEFTGMERAVLILQGDPPRIFKSAALEESIIQDIAEISRTATLSASERQEPFVCSNANTDPFFASRPSIIANSIMSIVCLPLATGDRLVGYLYLDSREGVETLATTDRVLLEIFSSIIALALNHSLILEESMQENSKLRASFGLEQEFPEIVGNSKPILDVLKTVHQLLDANLPVLITGETGTGKELIARVLHYCGKRKDGPFVVLNGSALTEGLLESELFGHEKGSFTGAIALRKGLFEEARNGTLFLDEVGEMPRSMQVKFLRVLQDGEFRRVGGNEIFRTNARIILATNRNLLEMVRAKEFREDLYYRIKGAQILLPSLRQRPDDIPLLAVYFLKSAQAVTQKRIRGFTPEAIELMKRYAWPGNVRQLRNEIEKIAALSESEWIRPKDFDAQICEAVENQAKTTEAPGTTLRETEKALIVQRLEENRWNIFHTARSLGLTRNGLYSKMRLYRIQKPS